MPKMRAHRSCQRKNVSLALSRMRRNRFPPNQSGAGEPKRNRNRQLAVPVGVSRIARNVPSRNSAPLIFSGFGQKGGAARHRCVITRKVFAPHTRTQVCLPITGSTPLPDAGQPRPFVSKQKDAKIAFPTYILAASEIASDFHAAAPVEQQILGRPPAFASCPSAIFMGHSVYALSAESSRPTLEVSARRWCQRKNSSPARRRMRKNRFSPNQFGAVAGRRRA